MSRRVSHRVGSAPRLSVDRLEVRTLLSAAAHDVVTSFHGAACAGPGCLPPTNVQTHAASARRPSGESLSIPVLSSNPSAPVTIYLDFDGDAGGNWGGSATTPTPAFDSNGDPLNFDSVEIEQIRAMWRLVTDAFSPFNVNVTTVNPGTLVDGKSIRAVVGGDGAWTGGSYGGMAYVGSFLDASPNTVWVFSEMTGKGSLEHIGWTARVIAHELGHAFGLQHQSLIGSNGANEDEYDRGTALTSPIMGYQYAGQRSTWRVGLNTFGQLQDDVATMLAGGLKLIADDIPAGQSRPVTIGGATPVSGRIETPTDTDAFTFTLTGARVVQIRVDPPVTGADGLGTLDAAMRLTGPSVDRDLDTFALGETLSLALQPGNYTITVRAGSTNLGYFNLGSYGVSVSNVDAVAGVDMNDARTRVTWSAVPGATVYVIRASSRADPYASLVDTVSATGAATQSKDYTFFSTAAEFTIEAYASATNLTTPIARYGSIRADGHDLSSDAFRPRALGDVVEAEDFITQWIGTVPNPNPLTEFEMRTIDLTADNLGNARHYRPTAVDLDLRTDSARPGVVLTRTQVGEELSYYIGNRAAGTYAIEARVSNAQAGGSMAVRLDSGLANVFNGTMTIPNTGSLNTYTTIRTAPFTLEEGIAGFYRVLKIKFLSAGSSGSAGNIDSFQLVPVTIAQPPAAPGNLVATYDAAANAVRLNWTDRSSDEVNFVVQRRLRGQSATAWQYTTYTPANGTTVTDTTVAVDTAYEYRVLSVNGAGAGISNTASVTTTRPTTKPAAPTGVRASFDSAANVVRVLWQDNSNNETSFLVQRRYRGEAESAWRTIATAAANATTALDTQITRNVVYEYRVLASNAAGSAISWVFQIPISAINAPTTLRTQGAAAANNVLLAWADTSTNETAFEIERRLAGGAFVRIGTSSANVITFRDATAAANTRYEYRVRAVRDASWLPSDYSNVLVVTVPMSVRSDAKR